MRFETFVHLRFMFELTNNFRMIVVGTDEPGDCLNSVELCLNPVLQDRSVSLAPGHEGELFEELHILLVF